MRRHHHFDSNNNHHQSQEPTAIEHTKKPSGFHDHPIHRHHHQAIWSSLQRVSNGFLDSLRISRIVSQLQSNRALRSLIVQNSALQLLCIASLVALEAYADSHRSSSNIRSTLDILFNIFWLFPIGMISIAMNGTITESCLHSKHRTQEVSRIVLPAFTIASWLEIVDYLKTKLRSDYPRILILLNYLLMAKGLLWVPFVGFPLSFTFSSIGNSFYCFEPYWLKDGLKFEERLNLLEQQWDYHLGFGLIMTTLTSIWPHHNILNLSLFTLLFPFLLIILSVGQKPLVHRPTSAAAATATEHKKEDGRSGHHSHPIQLPLFFISRKLHLTFFSHHPHNNSHLHHPSVHDGHVLIEDGGDHL
ncbi:hypothetical protein PGT21_009939 [Puccinia graminis f. sp. tritici]|uniref:Uncharacterized protein n=1 Tax=Puccinia graminis f. sp. tritici TaxID=56615 RepID=A0A5B0LSA7_PUCGR|nr:hypothetical protein PGTUg99_030331 [Puccinia graminis f. sp. tritici]KAA1071500.1 hypothetical protein PGT21_009939 [Puccinia graminis f. sp. tritici]